MRSTRQAAEMAARKPATRKATVTAPVMTVGKAPDETAAVKETDETWIVYTDDDGKTRRITVDKYHKEGRG